ncbi:MAG: hypothetical protein U0325_27460 [Polyangiales bacterium]
MPPQVVPAGSVEPTSHTGEPVEHETRPVAQARPMSHAEPSLQGTQAPAASHTIDGPQTVPAGCAPASWQTSTGRPPEPFKHAIRPTRHGVAMKQLAPSRQKFTGSGSRQTYWTSVEMSVGVAEPSGDGFSVAISSR